MELVSGGLLQSLLEASLLLVALHPGKDVQGQPYVLLIRAVFPTSVGNTWTYLLQLQLRITAPRTLSKLANTLRDQQPTESIAQLMQILP